MAISSGFMALRLGVALRLSGDVTLPLPELYRSRGDDRCGVEAECFLPIDAICLSGFGGVSTVSAMPAIWLERTL